MFNRCNTYNILSLIILLILLTSCTEDNAKSETTESQPSSILQSQAPLPTDPLLERLKAEYTNVHFSNNVSLSDENTSPTHSNLYAGGGIAIGDINNDNLQDFVIISNQEAPGVYLNKGKLKFEDISKSSGLTNTKGWTNGVVMEDVNGDGYIDIYISKGIYHNKQAPERENLLYINNKDNTFTESAKDYGIASTNITIQSVFFDYDLDGDLDLYLLNQPLDLDPPEISSLGYKRINNTENKNSDILYRNEGNVFKDVSETMGITNWGHGQGIVVSDIDDDGYPDIYITNDMDVDNFLYLNRMGQKFSDANLRNIKHQSFNPKGVDIADFNNDGKVDIYEVDIMPTNRKRAISNITFKNLNHFKALRDAGLAPQYSRNSLQLNRARARFSEVAQIGNVSKTDWSWGTLLVDLNDDGFKDILVTNGIAKDINNKDDLKKRNDLKKTSGDLSIQQQLDNMSSNKIENFAFQNNKDGTFSDKSVEWGFSDAGFSNGFAHADLDNDGDLDLLVNNINEKPWIYKNLSVENGQNTINFKLNGSSKNRNGIGAKIKIYIKDQIQYVEQFVVRGFMSSSQPIIHFGLGDKTSIDSLEIKWPNGKQQNISNPLAANKIYTLNLSDATKKIVQPSKISRIFNGASRQLNLRNGHLEVPHNDYKKESLLPHKLSQLGPALSAGDVNKDGLDDIFIGSANPFPSQLYLSQPNGLYQHDKNSLWPTQNLYEDVASEIFDADNDGDLDIYVCSGSNQFEIGHPNYEDRLYLNDGAGNFTKSTNIIPKMYTSTGSVKAADLDGDNDMDLFVGGRLIPGQYPRSPRSYILVNENGVFKDKTKSINKSIENIGMVTCAEWTDFDQDGDKDLMVAGEWMGIKLFENNNGKLEEISNTVGLSNTEGWWFTIKEIDFDKDGDKDYVVGNIGLNHKFRASPEKPLQIFNDDFDDNGTSDIVIAYYENNKLYPVKGRDFLSKQMPFIKEKYSTYSAFSQAEMKDIFGSKMNKAFSLKAKIFASIILENNGGKFDIIELPYEAQLSALRGAEEYDFNSDGFQDLVISGNMTNTEVETSPADANYGSLLLGDGKGNYKELPLEESGIYNPGDVRHIKMIDYRNQKLILIANNNTSFQSYITSFEDN